LLNKPAWISDYSEREAKLELSALLVSRHATERVAGDTPEQIAEVENSHTGHFLRSQ
jgi:hypothetical protein